MTRELTYLDLNPRDEFPHFVGLLVEHPTGVVYGNQTGGLACIWRSMEGFLTVLGTGAMSMLYIDFFKRFDGRPPVSGREWDARDLAELSVLVSRTDHHVGTASGFGELMIGVRLDDERLDDLTEGWIPVRVGDRSAVIVFVNSD